MTRKTLVLTIAGSLIAAAGIWSSCFDAAQREIGSVTPATERLPAAPPTETTASRSVDPDVHTAATPEPPSMTQKADDWRTLARERVAFALLHEFTATLSSAQKRDTLDRIEQRTRDRFTPDHRDKARQVILGPGIDIHELHDSQEVRKYKEQVEKRLRRVRPPTLGRRFGSASEHSDSKPGAVGSRSARRSGSLGLLSGGGVCLSISPIVRVSGALECPESMTQHCYDIAAAQSEAGYHYYWILCYLDSFLDLTIFLNHSDCDNDALVESEHEYEAVLQDCLDDHGC